LITYFIDRGNKARNFLKYLTFFNSNHYAFASISACAIAWGFLE
jgi:hypothetical protein